MWVPGYSFYGWIEGVEDGDFPRGQVIAIVDSQFDVDSYYAWDRRMIAY